MHRTPPRGGRRSPHGGPPLRSGRRPPRRSAIHRPPRHPARRRSPLRFSVSFRPVRRVRRSSGCLGCLVYVLGAAAALALVLALVL